VGIKEKTMLDKDGDFNLELKHSATSTPDGISIEHGINGKFRLIAGGIDKRSRVKVSLMLDVVEMFNLQIGIGELLKDWDINKEEYIEKTCMVLISNIRDAQYLKATICARQLIRFIEDTGCQDVLPEQVIKAVSYYLDRGTGMSRDEQVWAQEFVDKKPIGRPPKGSTGPW
jgi:hypothetical protein